MTEADDHLHTNAIGKMNIQNYSNNNKCAISNFENDLETNERILNLRNIADKAPKLNIEVFSIYI